MRIGGLKTAADYKLQKQLAAEDSEREARDFVHKHKDLILGASSEAVECAVQKIAIALRELRVAKLDAEIAKRNAITKFSEGPG